MAFPPRLSIPNEVLRIAKTLEGAGYETWCVGGAVRDALLGHADLDWDLATAATPDATLDPMMPDANSIRVALGGRFAVPGGFHITAGLTTVQYASRDNTGRSTLTDAQLPTRRPDGGGQYELWLGLFQVSLEKQL